MIKKIFLIIFLCSCSEFKKENVVTTHQMPLPSLKKENKSLEPKKMLPMKKVEILVGGCSQECSEPMEALFNYLTYLKNTDINNAMKFIDTTTLKYNGNEFGEEWARLWLELKMKKRKDSIELFSKEMVGWIYLVRDKNELEDAIVKNIKKIKIWSSHAEFHFFPPHLTDEKKYGAVWKYVLKPRGLEWLITEINMSNFKGD